MSVQKNNPALDEAISKMGSAASLAKSLDIEPSAITGWKNKGVVPVSQCISVEKLTGVKCERLKPTQDWKYLKKNKKPNTKKTEKDAV